MPEESSTQSRTESPGEPISALDRPSPNSHNNPLELRRHCFRLISELTRKLGWRYKLWIPAAILLSLVYLLPQRFLQYFTEGSARLTETGTDEFLKLLLVFGIAVALCQWVANFIESIISEWLRLKVSISLKEDAVRSLHKSRIESLDEADRGDWMTRMSNDLYNAEDFVTRSLPEQITSLSLLVGAAILFFYSSGTIAFIPLFAALLLGWVNILVQRRIGPVMARARQLEGNVFQAIIESFEGVRTVRTFSGEAFILSRIKKQLAELYSAGMKITRTMASVTSSNELAGQFVITGVLTLIAYQIRGGELTAEDALVYPFFISLFLGSAKSLAGAAYDWNRFFIEGGRLASVLYDKGRRDKNETELFSELWEHRKEVYSLSADDITISYGSGPPIVRDQSLVLRRGELTLLRGPSGSGKSTLIENLAGLRKAMSGEYKIELNSGGSFTYPQSPPFLSALVEQQPYLFVDSVRENIRLGGHNISDQRIQKAIDEVGLTELLATRNSLDQVLNDRGSNFSVGQQYRLSLCRALVTNRPFLLLDEPFAALDPESVDHVVEVIHRERENGRGILLVTHLFPSSLKPDRIVTLESSHSF